MAQPINAKSNYWLQTLILDKKNSKFKNLILAGTNKRKIKTRPCWIPMHKLQHFKKFPKMDLANAEEIYKRVINIPSSSHLKLKV